MSTSTRFLKKETGALIMNSPVKAIRKKTVPNFMSIKRVPHHNFEYGKMNETTKHTVSTCSQLKKECKT